MARIHKLNSQALKDLNNLLKAESVFQQNLCHKPAALQLAIEYTFLSGFKIWENFLEGMFISQSRYNDPVSGKRTFPYLSPNTEKHALDIIKLEMAYIDWTSPDNVIKRAEILFRNHAIISNPIKSNIQDLRDAKKIRNYIAHGGNEAKRDFDKISQRRIGSKVKNAGVFLLRPPIGRSTHTHLAVYYLELFKSLTNLISK